MMPLSKASKPSLSTDKSNEKHTNAILYKKKSRHRNERGPQ